MDNTKLSYSDSHNKGPFNKERDYTKYPPKFE